jgi:3'(2'), 5'-bisphosphate nucleotidase
MSGPTNRVVDVARIAEEAGEAIMRVLGQLSVTYKDDKSPVTNADHAAHAVIGLGLAKLAPEIPMISEENIEHPVITDRFWCVDPLDGTRSVLEGKGEFVVSIGLVENGSPVFGVIYCPLDGVCYAGEGGVGAWKKEAMSSEDREWKAIHVATQHKGKRRAIVGARDARSVGRRMHALLAKMDAEAVMFMSSARKFGVVAEGLVDVYPRFMRTYEWDTAAGQAIVEAAGGSMKTMEGGGFLYGKLGFENGPFICEGGRFS